MKTVNKLSIFVCIATMMVILLMATPVHAAELEATPEILKVRTTLYTLHGTTASGVQTHHGCISGKKNGQVAA